MLDVFLNVTPVWAAALVALIVWFSIDTLAYRRAPLAARAALRVRRTGCRSERTLPRSVARG